MRFEHSMTRHGSPLYVLQMPHVTSVAVGVLVFAGTRDEVWPKEAGIAHALEHMVFKGHGRLADSQAISSEIELLGGRLNAWTDKEMTFYHRIVPDDGLYVAVDSLASQVSDPLFRPEDITKEMKNVVQEIKRAYDAPAGYCARMFDEVIYDGHPLGKPTLGTEESVAAFTQDDFQKFHERLYHSANYVFIVVGNATLASAERAFNNTQFNNSGDRTKNAHEKIPVNMNGRSKVFGRDIKQANICFGALVGTADDADTKALDFYSTMLDGGMSFPLFQEVRDKRGLCYAVSAGVAPSTEHSVFQAYIGTEPSRIHEAIDCIHDVVTDTYADEELFLKARKNLLGKNAIDFTSPSAILNRAAIDLIFSGQPKSPTEIKTEVEVQTLDGVTEAVEKYLLNASAYSYAYVVPHGTKI